MVVGQERILLAMIGILEEIRSQTSVPAWIRGGGLWGPKGCPTSTAPWAEAADSTEVTMAVTREDAEGDTNSDISLSSACAAPEVAVPAIQWWEDEEVVQHWVEKATLVLDEMSIPVVPGILDPREDAELAELRSRRQCY